MASKGGRGRADWLLPSPIRRSDPEGIEHHISGLCPEMMGIILSNPEGHRRQLKEIVYGVL
jgi:hypothetical protein